MSVPFPSGNFVDAVRESSKSATHISGITINDEAITRLLLSPAFTTTFKTLSKSHGMSMPLKFPSILSELNLISVLSVLNMASGYRVPLHKHSSRGAFDTIRVFVMSMYLSSTTEGDYLSANGMIALDQQKVAELIGLSDAMYVEKPHDKISAVVIGELGGPIYELVKLVTKIMNETGEALKRTGYPNLGTFVLEALQQGKGDPDAVLQNLIRAIPAFRDMAVVNGQPVYIFKKVLLLLHAINLRFSSSSSFPVPETSYLPVFSDNVLPSMLAHLGVINLSTSDPTLGLRTLFPASENLDSLLEVPSSTSSEDQTNKTPLEGPMINSDQSYVLRAAAIEACERIVQTARSLQIDDAELVWINSITLPELDAWIWAGAKARKDYRQLPRFVLRNTEFF